MNALISFFQITTHTVDSLEVPFYKQAKSLASFYRAPVALWLPRHFFFVNETL